MEKSISHYCAHHLQDVMDAIWIWIFRLQQMFYEIQYALIELHGKRI